MDYGFIYLHRKIKDSWIWKNPLYFQWFIHLLFRANFKDNKVLLGADLYDVKRGSFITSIQKLTLELNNCTTQKIRTFLKLLEKDNMIVIKTTSKLTILSICKYDTYQTLQQTNNKPITNQQQTNNKPVTTENKEEIKIEKDNNKNIHCTLTNFKHLSITITEYQKLLNNYTELQITDIFNAIDNNKRSKNYTSLYLTALKWLKKDNTTLFESEKVYKKECSVLKNIESPEVKFYFSLLKQIKAMPDLMKKQAITFEQSIKIKNSNERHNVYLLRNLEIIAGSDEVRYTKALNVGIMTWIKNNSKALN